MKIAPLILLTIGGLVSAQAQTVVSVSALQDTSIFQSGTSNSDGGGPGIFAGTNGAGSPRRGLLQFNLSSIPAGATVTNVQLTLTLGQFSGAYTSGTIDLYDLTKAWTQGTVESGASSIGGTGSGAAANAGDATWTDEYYSSTSPTLWTTAGGDHSSTLSGALAVTNATQNVSYTAPSTAQLVADVQGWLNNPSTNFGWELINADESDSSTVFGFYSSEWDNAHFGGSSTQVPALQVTYIPAPEPASGSLLGMAAISLLGLRRRRA
jgi:hypothetical protein